MPMMCIESLRYLGRHDWEQHDLKAGMSTSPLPQQGAVETSSQGLKQRNCLNALNEDICTLPSLLALFWFPCVHHMTYSLSPTKLPDWCVLVYRNAWSLPAGDAVLTWLDLEKTQRWDTAFALQALQNLCFLCLTCFGRQMHFKKKKDTDVSTPTGPIIYINVDFRHWINNHLTKRNQRWQESRLCVILFDLMPKPKR